MSFSMLLGVSLSVVAFCNVVVGDPTSIVTLSRLTMAQNECGYYGPCSAEVIKTKKSSQLTLNIQATEDLPPEMLINFHVYLNGPHAPPLIHNMTLCDALSDPSIGQSLAKSGVPKETFPMNCPIPKGNWAMVKWNPPVHLIPTGMPPGPISGQVRVGMEGEPWCMEMDFEGEMTHGFSGMGMGMGR